MQSIPTHLQAIPTNLQRTPTVLQTIPTDLQAIPTDLQAIPEELLFFCIYNLWKIPLQGGIRGIFSSAKFTGSADKS